MKDVMSTSDQNYYIPGEDLWLQILSLSQEDGTNDNITEHTNVSIEPKQDEVSAKNMATVSENNTNLNSKYINVGKVTFMQALGLSLRSKYVGFTNKEYTSKFLRSWLVCVDILEVTVVHQKKLVAVLMW